MIIFIIIIIIIKIRAGTARVGSIVAGAGVGEVGVVVADAGHVGQPRGDGRHLVVELVPLRAVAHRVGDIACIEATYFNNIEYVRICGHDIEIYAYDAAYQCGWQGPWGWSAYP